MKTYAPELASTVHGLNPITILHAWGKLLIPDSKTGNLFTFSVEKHPQQLSSFHLGDELSWSWGYSPHLDMCWTIGGISGDVIFFDLNLNEQKRYLSPAKSGQILTKEKNIYLLAERESPTQVYILHGETFIETNIDPPTHHFRPDVLEGRYSSEKNYYWFYRSKIFYEFVNNIFCNRKVIPHTPGSVFDIQLSERSNKIFVLYHDTNNFLYINTYDSNMSIESRIDLNIKCPGGRMCIEKQFIFFVSRPFGIINTYTINNFF